MVIVSLFVLGNFKYAAILRSGLTLKWLFILCQFSASCWSFIWRLGLSFNCVEFCPVVSAWTVQFLGSTWMGKIHTALHTVWRQSTKCRFLCLRKFFWKQFQEPYRAECRKNFQVAFQFLSWNQNRLSWCSLNRQAKYFQVLSHDGKCYFRGSMQCLRWFVWKEFLLNFTGWFFFFLKFQPKIVAHSFP